MAIATLTIDLVAKLADLQSGFDRAAQVAERNAARIEESFKAVGAAVKSIAGAIAVDQVVSGLMRVVEGLDRFNDLKAATGASVENLSALEDIVVRGGESFEAASGALVKFNRALEEAKPNNEIGEVFERLGLSVAQLRAADPVQALQQTAKAFAEFAVNGNSARAAQKLFGKSIEEVAPILDALAQSGRLNARVTTEQAAQADEFNKALGTLKKLGQDIGRTLVSELLPGFTSLVKALNESSASAQVFSAIATALKVLFQTIAVLGANVAFVFVGIGREIAAVVAQLAAVARLDFDAFKAIGQAVKEDGVLARAELEKFEQQMLGLGETTKQVATATKDQARDFGNLGREVLKNYSGGRDAIAEALAEMNKFTAELDKQREATEELSNVERALQLLRDNPSLDNAALRESLLARAQQADQLKQEIELRKEVDRITRDQLSYEKSLRDQILELSGVAEETRKRVLTEQLEIMIQQNNELKAQGEQPIFSEEQIARAVRGIAGLNEQMKEQNRLADQLGLSFQSAYEDAVIEGKKFGDVITSLLKDIQRVILRELVTAPLLKALQGALNGSGGSGGGIDWGSIIGLIGSFFGSASGSGSGSGLTGAGDLSGNAFVGTASAGAAKVSVNVINNAGAQVSTQSRSDGNGGVTLDVIVGRIESQLAANVQRGRGELGQAVAARFGLRTQAG